jgi:hypothetical protein
MKFKEWMKGCEVMNTFTNVQGSCVITYKYPTYFLLFVKLQCCRPLDNFSITSFLGMDRDPKVNWDKTHSQRGSRRAHPLKEMWGYTTILFATTCDYVSFVTTFATTIQLHQICGGFAIILRLMCNYYLLHPPMWMLLGLYSSINKFQ